MVAGTSLTIKAHHARQIMRVSTYFNPRHVARAVRANPGYVRELPYMARAAIDWSRRAITEDFRNRETIENFIARCHKQQAQTVVVALHGYFAVGKHFHPVYGSTLQREYGIPLFTPEYPTFRDIHVSARYVGTLLKNIIRETDASLAVVGHSLGGLVAVQTYYDRLSETEQSRVSHLISLCSPHQGTPQANFGYGTSARQMRKHDRYITGWQERYPSLHDGTKVTAFYSPGDGIVSTADTELPIPHSKRLSLETLGASPRTTHVGLLYDRTVAQGIGRMVGG